MSGRIYVPSGERERDVIRHSCLPRKGSLALFLKVNDRPTTFVPNRSFVSEI